MRPSLARRLPLLLLPLLLFSTGCLPGLDWLPDSSGFVYSGGKGKKQLMLFDVKVNKSKALVAEAVGNTWPSVSPDGKKIAAAVRSQRGDTAYVTVRVFGTDGKLLHRSKEIEWKRLEEGKGKDTMPVMQAGWSPAADKLLLANIERTAIYDLKTGAVTSVEGNLLTFGNRPVRPDGGGAVTYAGRERFLFVDWSGKARPITVMLPKKGKEDASGPLFVVLALLYDSGWEGKTARLRFDEGELRLDTEKRTGALREDRKAASPGAARQAHTFPGGTIARAVGHEKKGGVEQPLALEVLRPKAKEPEVIVKSVGVIKFYPSPDGRLLAVRYAPSVNALYEGREDRILVLDAQGKKIADFPVAE